MKQRQNLVLTALTPLLALALVGFTLRPESPPPGTYTMSVADEDVPANVPAEARRSLVGKWEMSLLKENKFEISKDGNVMVQGSFAVEGEQLIVTDEEGMLACSQQPGAESGTYRFSHKEKTLTFTVVEDNCDGRRFVLTFRPWHEAVKP